MERIETKEDSDVYACKKCHATNTFMRQSPYVQKKSKEIQLGTIKLVDKSSERKYDYKNREQAPGKISDNALATIRKAMSEKKLLKFDYPKEKSIVTRITEPYKLALDGSKNLILWAYCTDAEGIRIYKIERMQNIELQEYTYTPRWGIEDKLNDKDKSESKEKA